MNTFWYEPISEATPAEFQKSAFNEEAPVHLRLIRPPPSVQELIAVMDVKYNTIMWLDETSHFCISYNRNSRLDVSIEGFTFHLMGQSDHEVAKMAFTLLTLENRNRESYIEIADRGEERRFDFDEFTPDQIECLLLRNAERLIFLDNLIISSERSVVLASQPQKIELQLCRCLFMDGGEAFLSTLEQRSTSFGTLQLYSGNPFGPFLQRRIYQLSTLDNLWILDRSQDVTDDRLLPFHSMAQKVKLCMGPAFLWRSIESISIVPKKFVLVVDHESSDFASVFLRATGNLTEMGIVFDCSTPSDQEYRDLLTAIEQNQNLEVLELGELERFKAQWDDLMHVIGSHQSLWRLKLKSIDFDFGLVVGLKSMLNQNRKITDIQIVSQQKSDWTYCLNGSLSFNRFYQRSKLLVCESESNRMTLLSLTLSQCRHDVKRTALLLLDHVDVLCALLKSTHTTGPTGSGPLTLETSNQVSSSQPEEIYFTETSGETRKRKAEQSVESKTVDSTDE